MTLVLGADVGQGAAVEQVVVLRRLKCVEGEGVGEGACCESATPLTLNLASDFGLPSS